METEIPARPDREESANLIPHSSKVVFWREAVRNGLYQQREADNQGPGSGNQRQGKAQRKGTQPEYLFLNQYFPCRPHHTLRNNVLFRIHASPFD
jgi:hypothetical protein